MMSKTLLSACLLLCATLAGAPAQAQTQAGDRLDRAQALMQSQNYAAALREFEAIYADRQAPDLLLLMGEAHQRLGHSREAVELFRRYLVAEQDVPAERRADIERRIAHLSQQFSPPAAPAGVQGLGGDVRMVPVRVETRPHYGLIGGGVSLLSTAYAAAFISGTIYAVAGGGSSSRSLSVAGGLLIIPVIGPFLSGIYLPSAGKSDAALYWSLPWVLVDGAAQVAGLAMTIAGARAKRKVLVPALLSDRLRLSPYATADGGGVVALGRF